MRVGRFASALVVVAAVPTGLFAQSVVAGPAADRPLPWSLERRWQLGGGGDDELQLTVFLPKDLAVDAHGRLLVIDRARHRVLEFDSAGAATRTFGREGMGPGELRGPVAIDVAPDGAIHIDDAEKGQTVVFAADGSIRPEYRPTSRLWFPRFLADGREVGTRRDAHDTVRLVVASASRATALAALRLPRTRSTPPVCRVTDYPAEPIFSAPLLWAARGNRIVAAAEAFRITVFDGDVPQRVLTRATPRRRSTPALARRQLGPGKTIQILGLPPCTVPADLILSVAEIAEQLPAYEWLALAPDGRIWATRFAVRGESGVADVYDPVRGYEGTVALGSAGPTG